MRGFFRIAIGVAVGLMMAPAHAGERSSGRQVLILSPNGGMTSCMAAGRSAGYGRADRVLLCQRWRDDNENARREYGTNYRLPERLLGRDRRWGDRR